jgi:hypothetical protein
MPHSEFLDLATGSKHTVRIVPKISQDTLAEMVGTTRSRVISS